MMMIVAVIVAVIVSVISAGLTTLTATKISISMLAPPIDYQVKSGGVQYFRRALD